MNIQDLTRAVSQFYKWVCMRHGSNEIFGYGVATVSRID